MVGELITLPLRATGAAARLWWRAADQALSLASSAAGYVIDRVNPVDSRAPAAGDVSGGSAASARRTQSSGRAKSAPAPAAPTSPGRTAPSEPQAQSDIPPAPDTRSETATEEPAHVSEEPELVEEFAEPGAEGGAGAELRIREPWKGYRKMSARDITARLADASGAELAAVELYENSNRGRQSILAAVARQLRSRPSGRAAQPTGANGSGTQRQGGHRANG